MSEAARMAEAEKLIKSAQKKVKKSFTKWTISCSDYDIAAMNYEQAAKIYQHMRKHDLAIEAWQNAADMHENAENFIHAGRAYDSIASIHKELKNIEKEAAAIEKGGEMYKQDLKLDKQAESMRRAAKVIAERDPARACKLLKEAIKILGEEELWHLMGGPCDDLITLYVKQAQFLEAAEAVKTSFALYEGMNQMHNISRGILAVVVLHLARTDAIMARRELDQLRLQFTDVADGEDCSLATSLLSAYEEGDEEDVKQVLKNQIFTFLKPTEIARLTRKLTVGMPVRKKKPDTAAEGEQPAPEGPNPEDFDDVLEMWK